MSKRDVWFESVELNRVLGIKRSESFSIPNFVRGINLIYGPNGSGKSTTARVIRELIWPGQTGLERPTVSGRFHHGDQDWSVGIDAGNIESACGDDRGVTPDFGPVELSERYHLALHALIVEDNEGFAQEIFRSSQGGFDLEAAGDACDFDQRPSKPQKLGATCKNKLHALNEAKQRQEDLATEYERLEQLENERLESRQAEADLVLLEKTQNYLVAMQDQRDLKVKLDALPDALERLNGSERTKLNTHDTRIDELEEKLSEERDKIEIAEGKISELALPDEEVVNATLAKLRIYQRNLADVELDQREQNKALREARTAADIARRRMGDVFTDDQLASLDAIEVDGLAPFAREAAQVQAERAVLNEKQRWLEIGDATEFDAGYLDHLREGLAALGRWLGVPAGTTSAPWWRSKVILGVAVTMALASVVFVLIHHIWWVLMAIPAIAVIALELLRLLSPGVHPASSAQSVHQSTFEKTGLQAPTAWKVESVTEHMRVLAKLLASGTLEIERKQRREEPFVTEKDLDGREAALETRSADLSEELGLSIELDKQWLPALVQNLIVWQGKNLDWGVAKTTLDEDSTVQQTLIGDIEAALQVFDLERIEDAGALNDLIQDIDIRKTNRSNLNTDLKNAKRNIKDVFKPELNTQIIEREALFKRLHIEEGEEHFIDTWLQDFKDFQELNKDLAVADAVCGDRRKGLEGHDDLLELGQVDIDERIKKLNSVAERRDDISEEIADINKTVTAAKTGFDLADCALELATAKAELVEEKERGDAAIAGAMLADWVRTVSVEKSRPQVFRRANELFVLFTKGALQLDLDDSASPPRFLARRGSEPGRPVDELSIGERVQLLMAVRIAFIEQSETACLPLLMDEVLGTSDDERAAAIIDTVIALARNGRQVFYFTAQRDEIGKWVGRLDQEDLEHQFIDLGKVRNLSAAQNAPLKIMPIKVAKIPEPEGRDHRAYADLLGVPNLDPRTEHIDTLHLWHVVDDVNLLYQLLDHGIITWSQFRTLQDHGGISLVPIDGEHLHRIDSTARAAEIACAAWRVGRGKPVGRETLQRMACVSGAFIDKIADLAKRHSGDAERIIGSLVAREVPRWRDENTETLRNCLETEGYLTSEEPLTLETIRIRTMAAVDAELRDAVIDDEVIDRLIGSLSLV